MQATVVVLGSAGAVAPLTYAIPPEIESVLTPGHRVIVPVRSRRMTGIVIETGAALDADAGRLKPIAELLDPQPLFDRPHLELLNFLASYYMASITEVYRAIVPGLMRIESQRRYRVNQAPSGLMAAAFTPLERTLVAALERRAMTPRQLAGCGDPKSVTAALNRLVAEQIVVEESAIVGRHRESSATLVRAVVDLEAEKVRGPRQREILKAVAESGSEGISIDDLKARLGDIGSVLATLKKRGWLTIETAAAMPIDGDPNGSLRGSAIEMNEEQRVAFEAIARAVEHRRFESFLMWGVTASGKTEVYLNAAARALEGGRNVMVLVPEIALTDQLVAAFRARFGPLVAIAHSAQNVTERWSNWQAALGGRARIMIGPRSAIFAPLHDPGLIVVDEEHDPSYKNEDGIRYNARDLAVALGRFAHCPVVLGSATPSAESWVNARDGRYRLLRLARRVMDRPFAAVEIVDLRGAVKRSSKKAAPGAADDSAPDPVPLSELLVEAIRTNLADGGQTILFLNRRGYHNFLQCHLCGAVLTCSNCSVSMTFHLRDRSLRCHYCGERTPAPELCPECNGLGLEGLGFGTERLVSSIQTLVPQARIERMDSDTSGRRGERARIFTALARGEIDILVGTQMVTKGFDFPGVTMVGVINADLALNLPDFRSAERTFQLLTQVAGRAGRGERHGRVLIQTYAPSHYSISAARDQDYERFMRRELTLRRELGYPPFMRLALVRIESENAPAATRIAAQAANALNRFFKNGVRVLGPAPAPIERIRGRYRFQVMAKSEGLRELRSALAAMRAEVGPQAATATVRLAIDVDPINML
ncbi:MAG: primosomal protein N' [Candidatus Binataceae bacterium]|nr:primosomal protein N' [Candidatus Binataceae bacterium]